MLGVVGKGMTSSPGKKRVSRIHGKWEQDGNRKQGKG